MRLLPGILALLGASSAAWPAQEGGGDATERYPCRRPATVVRFFDLDTDEPDLARASAVLGELQAEIAYGPRTTGARAGHSFFALRAPPGVPSKKLAAALKKAGGAAHELECLAFDGRTGDDSRIAIGALSMTSRDLILGMSGDILWFDSVGSWSQFYGRPGSLEAEEIAERYRKLYAPYGGGEIGTPVVERFTWTLSSAPEEKARGKLLKALQKLDGVATVGLEGQQLTLEVRLQGLAAALRAPPTTRPR